MGSKSSVFSFSLLGLTKHQLLRIMDKNLSSTFKRIIKVFKAKGKRKSRESETSLLAELA